MAGYLGIALTRKSLSIPDGDLQAEWFLRANPLGQVPVLETREGKWLSESAAILCYLAEGSSFIPDTPLERATVLQWLMFEQTKLMWNLAQPRLWIALRKTMQADDPRARRWRERGYGALSILNNHLADSLFVAGASATVADVALYPYIRMA